MCELIYEDGMPYKEFAKLPKHPDVSKNVFLFLPKKFLKIEFLETVIFLNIFTITFALV